MDREQFDAMARFVWTKQSRRAAIGTLLGAALAGRAPHAIGAKNTRKDQRKVKVQAKAKTKACYAGQRCSPGPGKNASGCDYSGSIALFEGDFRGSNLSKSNFSGAVLAKCDFRGANLSGACLVGANLLEAKLGSSVNLHKAIFCQTLMPNGSLNNRDCGKGTPCCPAPTPCEGEACEGGTCVPPHTWCSIFGNPCCDGNICTPTFSSPFLTTCQKPCKTNADCPPGGTCGSPLDFEFCFYVGSCCN